MEELKKNTRENDPHEEGVIMSAEKYIFDDEKALESISALLEDMESILDIMDQALLDTILIDHEMALIELEDRLKCIKSLIAIISGPYYSFDSPESLVFPKEEDMDIQGGDPE